MTQRYALYNPATHVAVPREPTPEMIEAMPALPAICLVNDLPFKKAGWSMAAIQNRHRWVAAIAAAPPHVVDVMNLRNDIARLIDHTAFRPSSPGYPYQLDDQESALEKADEILNLLEVK